MRAKLPAYVRARLLSELERRRPLVEKVLRDPERFFADARSPYVRRAGGLASRLGWFPAGASDIEGERPRSVTRSLREYALVHAVSMTRGTLDHVEGNRLRGMASSGSDRPVAIAVRLDDLEIARFVAQGAFDVCVDMSPHDGRSATLALTCATSGVPLHRGTRTITVPCIEGAVASYHRGRLRGHVHDAATASPVYLDVVVDGRVACTLCVGADARRRLPLPAWLKHAFAVGYVARRADATLELRVRGTTQPILGTPLAFDSPRSTRPDRPSSVRDSTESTPPIHVVIPAHSGVDVTLRCVDSATQARNECAHHVTVIWDAGPDVALLHALRTRASSGAFTLLENAENLGFVRTCNRGMRLRPSDDVVLLNADTEVADGWLDRLARAARSASDIGTATPFSNAATICTYPTICEEAPLSQSTSVAEHDARFARVNAGLVVDLPTGHGFCLFIRRAMLDVVGLFDEEAFGRGYGEENDLCLRGRAAGFRSVLACDVFVKHVGSVSFGHERTERVRAALRTIDARFPDYAAEVERFIREDPPARARNRVALDTFRESVEASRGGILMITHHLGGGVEVNVKALSARLGNEGFSVLILSSHADGTSRLTDAASRLEATYQDDPHLASVLLEELGRLRLRLVHVHHLLTCPAAVQHVVTRLGVPFDVTLHDFFAVCPRVNFTRGDGTYCGEPPVAACDVCIATDGPHEGARVLEGAPADGMIAYRLRQLAWLSQARRVIVPSNDTARRVARVFPSLSLTVRAHPEAGFMAARRRPQGDGLVRVAVIGGIGLHKGYRRVLEVARHANTAKLPIRFVVFGTTIDSGALRALPNVTVTGRYTHERLALLVEDSRCTLALFMSIWPETYSYTLSEALALGLYPVCSDIGAPAERLTSMGYGTLLPLDADAEAICRTLLQADAHDDSPRHDGARASVDMEVAHGYYDLDVSQDPPGR